VDSGGNVYITDYGNNRVLKETLSAGSYTQTTVASGLSNPFGVAVDGGGNVYIADLGDNRVLMETLSAGSYTQTTVGTGLNSPIGVAVDGAGNTYIADLSNNRIVKVDVVDPPTLTLPSTALGASSATQTVTLANRGNAPLTLTGLATSSASFTVDTSATTCSTATPLAAAASCVLGVKFTPAAVGAFTGGFNITGNTLNVAGTAQAVSLTGTATQATPAVAVSAATAGYGTASTTLSATVTYVAGIAPTGAFTFTVGSGAAVTATCSSGTGATETCVASYPTAALSVAGYTITGSLAADTNYIAASSTGTLTVTQATPAITFAPTNHTYGDAPFPVSASSPSIGAFTFTVLSGPATVSSIAGTVPTVTITGAGTVTLQASQAAAGNYVAGTQTATLTVAQAPLTATAGNATRLFGTANPTFTGTILGAVYGDSFTESFTTTAAASSPVGTYPITPLVNGAALANYTLTATPGTLTVSQAPAAVTVTASNVAPAASQAVTLTAAVASTTSGTPTGTVVFYDNGTALQTVTLASGSASYAATLSPGATHVITASYSGDADFTATLAAASASTTVVVGALDFVFPTPTVPIQSVVPGQAATFAFQVAPPAGGPFPGVVTFSVTGLPPGATATFTPSTLPASSGATQVQMTVQTANTSSSNTRGPLGRATLPMAFAGLLLPLLGLRRRLSKMRSMIGPAWSQLPLLLLLAGGLLGAGAMTAMTGCGTASLTNNTAHSYTLIVTSTSGTLQHSQTVTLYVQ
jgi:hypothetical protein